MTDLTAPLTNSTTISTTVSTTPLSDAAAGYASLASSRRTATEYSGDMRHYGLWCSSMGLTPLPCSPGQAANYVAAHASTLAVGTLERRLAALSAAHRQAGMVFSTKAAPIAMVMSGIRRVHGTAQKQVRAATIDVVTLMTATCDESLSGLRDRALLLLGFATALRRSELVALTVADLTFKSGAKGGAADHLAVRVVGGKTDQERAGRVVIVQPVVVIEAVRAWLKAASITSGLIARSVNQHGHIGLSMSGRGIADMIQRRAGLAGLDGSEFSGHSLRAGFATTAAAAGASERVIARTTGHSDLVTLRKYIRVGTELAENASNLLGL